MKYFAIVAEYRGVAILECSGNKRKFYNKEYFTDGKSYVFFEEMSKEKISSLGFSKELEVKQFIDVLKDMPQKLPVKFQKSSLLSYLKAWEILHKNKFKGMVPEYNWNEESELFIHFDGVRDGQYRWFGAK